MPTFNEKIIISGHGVHSGLPVNMVINPSDKCGIYFQRTDIKNSDLIPALYNNVGETKMRNTTVGNPSGVHVQTIEHLMAALFIMGVDSAIIQIDDKEVPILDGSASEFLNMFKNIGISSGKMKKIIVKREIIATAKELLKDLSVISRIKLFFYNLLSGRRTNGYVKLIPNDGTSLDVFATLVYPERIIGTQSFSYSFDGTKKSIDCFFENVSRARTFGKYSEWEWLKKRGMGRGANENNVIALNDSGEATINSIIWPDEFVRHKVIDAIGDMFTSGGFVVGKLESYKGSHALNNIVLRKLFSNPENYEIIE